MKEKNEKAGLILNIQKTKIIPLQIEEEKVEAVTDFIFLGSKITADGDCSHEIKRRLLLGMKIMTSLDSMWETYMQVRKQQLELDMEQQTSSKLRKEYVKAVYFLFIQFICRVHHEKRWAGWSTS